MSMKKRNGRRLWDWARVCSALWLLATPVSSTPVQRGLQVISIPDSSGQKIDLKLYEGSYALVIGINTYTAGWPSLPGVAHDVAAVHAALEAQGFLVTLVENPTKDDLEDAFEKFIHTYGRQSENRLVFYFAGHGHTIRPHYGGNPLGYLVPANAPNPHDDPAGFKRLALSMQRIEEYALTMEAKHALFLFDSCFSGSIFSLSRAVPEHISYKTAQPVRQFITSGDENEQVPDESIFRQQFVAALGGEADTNQDGYVTGSELGEFLQAQVVNYSKEAQHPQYGKIRHPKLDKGDVVFQVAALPASSAAVTPGNTPVDGGLRPRATASRRSGEKQPQENNEVPAGEESAQERSVRELDKIARTMPSPAQGEDGWTSKPLRLAFMRHVFKPSTAADEALLTRMEQALRDTGRFTTVERERIEEIYAELKLNTTELVDPKTALRVGKIVEARLLAMGSISHEADGVSLTVYFSDTETAKNFLSETVFLKKEESFEEALTKSAESLLKKLRNYSETSYLLQGEILRTTPIIVLNLGASHGMTPGVVMELVEKDDETGDFWPVEDGGKIVVTDVQIQSSRAKSLEGNVSFQKGTRVREVREGKTP